MKMKKWIALVAVCGVAIGTMNFVACGGGAENINYAITIVDQDGDVVQGVEFTVLDGDKTVATLETNENGVANGSMQAGNYTVNYTEMPSVYYDVNPETAGIDIVRDFSISAGNANVTLVISNWTVGTSLNPYQCYYETDEETGETSASMHVPTVKANSDYYYEIAKSGDRIICIEQADVTILYKGERYTPKDGAIEIQARPAVAGDLNDWAKFQIINDTDSDIQLVMTFKELDDEEAESSESADTTSGEMNA